MRFNLVDRILELEPGNKIAVVKNLTLGEEYLADHFPTFPVMPGVLMLETLVQAGAWLLRISKDFRYSMIVARDVKNVKYGQFMEPGRQMIATVELIQEKDCLSTFKARGESDGKQTVSARISLHEYNLAGRDSSLISTDERLIAHWRRLYSLLRRAEVPKGAGEPSTG